MSGLLSMNSSFWPVIPQTSGRVFWVAPAASYTVQGLTYIASDNSDGLTPTKALLTLNRAVALATANVGDVIMLLPGAHSWAVSGAVSKAGLTVTGLPSGKGHPHRMRTSITTTAADQVLNVTAADVELAYIHLIPVTAQVGCDYSAAADRLYVHDCTVDLTSQTASTSTVGFAPTAAGADDAVFENIYAVAYGGQGPVFTLSNAGLNTEVRNATFKLIGTTAWADAVVSVTGTSQVAFIDCKWIAPSAVAITDPIDWTGQTDDNTLIVAGAGTYFSESVGVINCSADQDSESNPYAGMGKAILSAGGTNYPIVLNAG